MTNRNTEAKQKTLCWSWCCLLPLLIPLVICEESRKARFQLLEPMDVGKVHRGVITALEERFLQQPPTDVYEVMEMTAEEIVRGLCDEGDSLCKATVYRLVLETDSILNEWDSSHGIGRSRKLTVPTTTNTMDDNNYDDYYNNDDDGFVSGGIRKMTPMLEHVRAHHDLDPSVELSLLWTMDLLQGDAVDDLNDDNEENDYDVFQRKSDHDEILSGVMREFRALESDASVVNETQRILGLSILSVALHSTSHWTEIILRGPDHPFFWGGDEQYRHLLTNHALAVPGGRQQRQLQSFDDYYIDDFYGDDEVSIFPIDPIPDFTLFGDGIPDGSVTVGGLTVPAPFGPNIGRLNYLNLVYRAVVNIVGKDLLGASAGFLAAAAIKIPLKAIFKGIPKGLLFGIPKALFYAVVGAIAGSVLGFYNTGVQIYTTKKCPSSIS